MGHELARKRAYQAALAGLEYGLFLLESQKSEQFNGAHSFPEAQFRYQVRNEEGKWDLNSLVDGDGKLDQDHAQAVTRFMKLVGLEKSAPKWIDRLADWIDRDSSPRPLGKETYSTYECRNVGFESFAECSLVLDRDQGVAKRLRKGCTIFSSGKINLNVAPPEVLASLSEGMTEFLVREIIKSRKRKRFVSVKELKNVQGMTDKIYRDIEDLLITDGVTYSIWVEGQSQDVKQKVGAVVKKEAQGLTLIWFQRELKDEHFLAWN